MLDYCRRFLLSFSVLPNRLVVERNRESAGERNK